jgi:hypothetical protein
MGREDLREDGEELRSLGQRIGDLGEQLGLLAQSYRDLFERLRIAVKRAETPPPAPAPDPKPAKRSPRSARVAKRSGPSVAPPAPPSWGTLGVEELDEYRRSLRALLDRQGEMGRQLLVVARNRLFLAGGEEPRKIMVRLHEFADRCNGLRLSSDSMVRGNPKAFLSLLDDLSEINSRGREDFQRWGAALRARGEGLLSGRKEDRRYLQGDSWRRSWF